VAECWESGRHGGCGVIGIGECELWDQVSGSDFVCFGLDYEDVASNVA